MATGAMQNLLFSLNKNVDDTTNEAVKRRDVTMSLVAVNTIAKINNSLPMAFLSASSWVLLSLSSTYLVPTLMSNMASPISNLLSLIAVIRFRI